MPLQAQNAQYHRKTSIARRPQRLLLSSDDMPERANTVDGASRCIWSNVMDDALVDAFLNQHTLGNMVGGTFTTHAIDNIVTQMKEKFADVPIDKQRVHNRMKIIKRQFSKCFDVFQNGMNGFYWDPATEVWNAEPEVWAQLIQAKPEAAEWKNKQARNYMKLFEIYGKDKAIGKESRGRKDTKARKNKHVQNALDSTAHEVENYHEDLPNRDTCASYTESEAPSSRAKKLKQSELEEMLVWMKNGMQDIAAAIRNLNRPAIAESEIWQLVSEMGLEPDMEPGAYMRLIRDVELLRAVIGYPSERRKSFLLMMMSDGN